MNRSPALILLLSACAGAPQDTTAAEYTLSLTLLDISAAVLLRDADALRDQLDESFTIHRQPWDIDPLMQALRRTVRKVHVTECHFVAEDGRRIPLSLTNVEPESELIKVFRRQPPHENVAPDLKALRRVGVQGNRIRGTARCWLLGGETLDVDFSLEIRIDSRSVKVQSLEYSRR